MPPQRTRSRGAGPRGYTLIELLIVVTLLGISSAVVIPSLGSTSVLRVQSTVRAIVASINIAQSEALAHQQGRAVVFDVTGNKYSILEVTGTTLNPSTDTIEVVDLNNQRKYHQARIDSADFDGDAVLVFDELGGPVVDPSGSTPSAGGSVTISGSGSVFRITVEPYTGRVTVTRISGP